MRHWVAMCILGLLPACSSSSSGSNGAVGGGMEDASHDTGGGGGDSSAQDSSSSDSSTADSGGDVTQGDASDGGCPSGWLVAPTVPASIEVPADGGGVLLHAAGAGTQNYACTTGSDGGASWVFIGPQADLSDCSGNVIGHHFASDGGAGSPEWLTTADGAYVIGKKVAAYTPDGGSGSVPWLLLQAVEHGGSGPLSQVAYVQRLDTDGGVAPGPGCDAGDMAQVPYTADYWFYGQ